MLVAVDTDTVAALGQAIVVLVGLHQVALRLQLLFEGLARCQAIGDFLEGRLDGLFVLGDVDVLLDFRVVQAGLQAAGVEDRQVDLRLEQPGALAAREQVAHVGAQAAGVGRQADAWEERCAGGADIGIGGLEQVFGFLDVRAALEDVGRQAGRYFRQLIGVELQRLGQVGRNAGAQQHGQAVDVLGDQALVLRILDPGPFHGGARLAQVQCRGHAHFIAAAGEVVAFLVGLQRFFGQLEQRLVGLPGVVGVGHAGHQGNLRGPPCLFAGQVGFQGLLGQAAYPAEQVQFIGADTQRGRVLAGDAGLTGLRHVRRYPLAATAGVGGNRREQVGPLNAILRAVRVEVQCGNTQVAVVDQRSLDQLLQCRVTEELAPALFGSGDVCRLRGGICRALRPLRSHRRFRGLVVRDQRAAAQNESGYRQGQQRLGHCPAS